MPVIASLDMLSGSLFPSENILTQKTIIPVYLSPSCTKLQMPNLYKGKLWKMYVRSENICKAGIKYLLQNAAYE